MTRVKLILIILLTLSSEVYSNTLPKSGSCKDTKESLFRIIDSVTWIGTNAIITIRGKTNNGKVIGMRPHDDGFKFSIIFTSDSSEVSELSIFRMPFSEPSIYRMALVTYFDSPNESRVISSNTGYKDASCIVAY